MLKNIGLWSDELISSPSVTRNIYLLSGNNISLHVLRSILCKRNYRKVERGREAGQWIKIQFWRHFWNKMHRGFSKVSLNICVYKFRMSFLWYHVGKISLIIIQFSIDVNISIYLDRNMQSHLLTEIIFVMYDYK